MEFNDIKRRKYDGMIITGAPVENLEFEEVNYWPELSTIMEWTKTHVTSTLHICWGAQAGLYYHYGIPKYQREKKLSGIYNHRVLNRKVPLVRSMNDYFLAPHSRYTEVKKADILRHPELETVSYTHLDVYKRQDLLFEQVKSAYPRSYTCVCKIRDYFRMKFHCEITEEEMTYLMLHIRRVTSREGT